MIDLSVIIPAYNEEKTLGEVAESVNAVLQTISGSAYEIIIINDGSTDETPKIADRLSKKNTHVTIITHTLKQGIGKCLADGFRQARYRWISFFPADGQIEPAALGQCAKALDDSVDFVTTVYHQRNTSLFRKIMSAGVRLLLRLLFGKFPTLEGIYLFHRKILDKICVNSRFVFNFELVIKAYQQGFRFKKISIVNLPRAGGKSKVANLKTIWGTFKEIICWKING
jgi:glycosyltransferase involved in cell wall biosynthesis